MKLPFVAMLFPAVRRGGLALAFCAALLAGCGDSPESLIASAKDYQGKGDHPAAIIQLRNALQQNPNNAEARFLLATSLLMTNDYVTAEKELRKALEMGYAEETVVPILARSMIDQGRGDEAVREFGTRPLKTPQGQAALHTTLGDAYIELDRPRDADAAYKAALASVPDHVPAQVGLARLKAVRGEMDEATRVADEILQKSPTHPDALNLRAAIYAVQQDYKQAATIYERLVAAEPHRASPRRALINSLIMDGQLEKAAGVIEEARKQAGGNDVRLLYQDALLQMRRENYNGARELAQQILRGYPDDMPTLLIIGSADLHLGNYEPAKETLRRVVEQLPRHDGARRLLITAYVRSGQTNQAIEVLQPLLQRPDVEADTLSLAGEVYLAAADLKRAEDYFARAVKMDKGNIPLRTRLGQVQLATGEQAQAIQELESASAADSAQWSADMLLVLGHMRAKDYTKAMEAYKVLEKKQPNSPITFNVKGTLLAAQNDLKGARAAFEHALKLRPDNFAALVNLARLDIKENRPDMAQNRFESAVAEQPKNDQLMLTYAQFLGFTGAPTETVLKWTQRAVDINPNSEAGRLSLMTLQAKMNDKKALLAAAQEAMAAMPNSARIMEAGGLAQLAAGDTNQAISTFNKLVQSQPKAVPPLMRLAQAQAAAKDVEGALDSLRKAQALEPEKARAPSMMVDVLGGAGRFPEAMTEAKRLQTRFPDLANGFALEGDVHSAQRRWKEAEAAYKEGIERDPNNTMLFSKAFRVMEFDKRLAEADAWGDKWLKAHPADIGARIFLAERSMQMKDFKGAVKQYKSVAEIAPKNIAVLNNLAWASGQLKDPAALGYAQQAYELAPNNPAVLDTLAMILLDRGEPGKALPYMEQAFKLAPRQPEIHFNYAKTLSRSGKKDAARKELQTLAKHEDPNIKAQAEEMLKTL
jgi:cellulose synthase operon protein C